MSYTAALELSIAAGNASRHSSAERLWGNRKSHLRENMEEDVQEGLDGDGSFSGLIESL